jgi:hypothetical protein
MKLLEMVTTVKEWIKCCERMSFLKDRLKKNKATEVYTFLY